MGGFSTVGAEGFKNHKHSNVTGDGGALDKNLTIVNGSTLRSFVIRHIVLRV